MTVTIRRTGGFAGLKREWSVIIDPDEPAWHELLERLPWRERSATAQGVDRYTYVVTCARRTTEIPEHDFTGAWQELFDRVRSGCDVE